MNDLSFSIIFNGIEQIRKHIQRNESEIEYLYYELSNVKGIDYTKEKRAYNKEAHLNRFHDLSEKIEEREKENKCLNYYIKSVETIYNMLSEADKEKAIRYLEVDKQ